MKELHLQEMSLKQKLGFVTNLCIRRKSQLEFILPLVRERAIGSIWVYPDIEGYDEVMEALQREADYPLLIATDAEGGIGDFRIGAHNALGVAGCEESAYAFGKAVAITARKKGYTLVCNPVLDMHQGNCVCGGNTRSISTDKYTVAKLGAAMIRGMHDGGVLTMAKHYPGASESTKDIDSHMGSGAAEETVEQLLEYNLYPYKELIRQDLLDCIMVNHGTFKNIDPDYPASLSKKVISIIRELGFNGLAMTDALNMMGVVAKFGKRDPHGIAIQHGIDIALPFHDDVEFCYRSMQECYQDGMIDDARLDEAVSRVLAAQHKLLSLPKDAELTEEEIANFNRINTDSIFAKTDEGVPVSVSRDGRHFFAILTEEKMNLDEMQPVGPMSNTWYRPYEIARKIKELFPNSTIGSISQFPSWHENYTILENSFGYEDVIFVTFFKSFCYIGTECLTSRILSLMRAMQMTNRISTVVHLGNPYVVEDIPHVSRLLIGQPSAPSALQAIEVLAGNYPAKGKLTYDVNFR